MSYTKRDAAVQVKRSLTHSAIELNDAKTWAQETGDAALQQKVSKLLEDTNLVKDDLARKLDSKTG